ncbi:MAG: hypothetical protein ACRDJI_06205 [Actinomycetota bacterium]
MTLFFLAVLAVAWIAVILPAALRARQIAPLSAAQRFKRRMQLIAPTPMRGRWVLVPDSRSRPASGTFRRGQQRRTRIFIGLLVAVIGSATVAILGVDSLWGVHFGADASLAVYCALLIEAKRRRRERQTKVRPLRRQEPEYVEFFEPAHARRA